MVPGDLRFVSAFLAINEDAPEESGKRLCNRSQSSEVWNSIFAALAPAMTRDFPFLSEGAISEHLDEEENCDDACGQEDIVGGKQHGFEHYCDHNTTDDNRERKEAEYVWLCSERFRTWYNAEVCFDDEEEP